MWLSIKWQCNIYKSQPLNCWHDGFLTFTHHPLNSFSLSLLCKLLLTALSKSVSLSSHWHKLHWGLSKGELLLCKSWLFQKITVASHKSNISYFHTCWNVLKSSIHMWSFSHGWWRGSHVSLKIPNCFCFCPWLLHDSDLYRNTHSSLFLCCPFIYRLHIKYDREMINICVIPYVQPVVWTWDLQNNETIFLNNVFFCLNVICSVANQTSEGHRHRLCSRTTCKWVKSSNKIRLPPRAHRGILFWHFVTLRGKWTFLMCDPPRLALAGRFYQQTRQASGAQTK